MKQRIIRNINDEDGVVVSESFAKKMTHWTLHDVIVDIYVGDEVTQIANYGDRVSAGDILLESISNTRTVEGKANPGGSKEKNDREGKGRDAVGITDDYLGKHWSDKKYDEMTTRDWRIFCEDFSISTKGGTAEKPLRNWHELNLIPPDLLDIITNHSLY